MFYRYSLERSDMILKPPHCGGTQKGFDIASTGGVGSFIGARGSRVDEAEANTKCCERPEPSERCFLMDATKEACRLFREATSIS